VNFFEPMMTGLAEAEKTAATTIKDDGKKALNLARRARRSRPTAAMQGKPFM
jgi:hypothetical protein